MMFKLLADKDKFRKFLNKNKTPARFDVQVYVLLFVNKFDQKESFQDC